MYPASGTVLFLNFFFNKTWAIKEKKIAPVNVTVKDTEENVKIKKKNIKISPHPMTSLKLFFKTRKECKTITK